MLAVTTVIRLSSLDGVKRRRMGSVGRDIKADIIIKYLHDDYSIRDAKSICGSNDLNDAKKYQRNSEPYSEPRKTISTHRQDANGGGKRLAMLSSCRVVVALSKRIPGKFFPSSSAAERAERGQPRPSTSAVASRNVDRAQKTRFS